jgi:hypothetical protein
MTASRLHTLYLDRPLKGALLMQTLARVNRTFRGKQDGLLVSYAPLVDNLGQALAEYSPTDQAKRPMGRNIDEAVALATDLLSQLDSLAAGYDWRARLKSDSKKRVAGSGTGPHGIPAQSRHSRKPDGGRDRKSPHGIPPIECRTRVARGHSPRGGRPSSDRASRGAVLRRGAGLHREARCGRAHRARRARARRRAAAARS